MFNMFTFIQHLPHSLHGLYHLPQGLYNLPHGLHQATHGYKTYHIVNTLPTLQH